ncbi:MAG: nucleotide pyrophosphohydrolase [Myxococcota bacterium]|nr:nucleotide pyrophosphohydrolase [Myxococcota bacterium]
MKTNTNNEFDTLNQKLAEFVKQREWEQFHTAKNMAICISVEANELLAHYTWTSPTGQKALGNGEPERQLVIDEAADVLLSLLSYARVCEFDLIGAARSKLKRLEEKYPVEEARGKAIKGQERPMG